ncbi:MAG: NAD(P)H-dependent oxidoreductase subunit E [Sciscionella sp.]
MDLHFLDATPSEEEQAAVDGILGASGSGWQGGERGASDWALADGGHEWRARRDELLPALHAVNDRIGWISQGALNYICQRLTIPPADAYGVASFYGLFSMRPRHKRVMHVCTDIVCKAAGSDAVCRALTDSVGAEGTRGETVEWHGSPCLGLCERAPAALVIEAGESPSSQVVAPVSDRDVVGTALSSTEVPMAEPPVELAVPQAGDPSLKLLRRIGAGNPESLADYRSRGGYQALRRAVRLGASGVLRELADAKLVGRGGAAFPTGRKWEAVAHQPVRPHYLVCNADESEPGTFKDRVLMEGDPFALIESMTIAAYTTGCRKGFLYLRGEYPRALARLTTALAQAREAGLLGSDIMGFGFDFDVEIRRGAGAYICGEETAIFASIEGFRGEPRTKPPFPVEQGLFGKPTVVNNVETLVSILPILNEGGRAFAATGTSNSTGTKLFCVSGAVRRPGIYELPFGATLRELMTLAGTPDGGRRLRAVLLGGAAGSFLRPDELDVPLTFEATRAAGSTIGSGVVVAIDDETDLGGMLLRIAGFFRDESCGQCVPCRVGTVRQEEALARITAGRPKGSLAQDLQLLREVGQAMRDASICGLGQTAWNAVESAIDRLNVFEEARPS